MFGMRLEGRRWKKREKKREMWDRRRHGVHNGSGRDMSR